MEFTKVPCEQKAPYLAVARVIKDLFGAVLVEECVRRIETIEDLTQSHLGVSNAESLGLAMLETDKDARAIVFSKFPKMLFTDQISAWNKDLLSKITHYYMCNQNNPGNKSYSDFGGILTDCSEALDAGTKIIVLSDLARFVSERQGNAYPVIQAVDKISEMCKDKGGRLIASITPSAAPSPFIVDAFIRSTAYQGLLTTNLWTPK